MGRPLNKRFFKNNGSLQIIAHVKIDNNGPVQTGIIRQFGTKTFLVEVNNVLYRCNLVTKDEVDMVENDMYILARGNETTFEKIEWIKSHTIRLSNDDIKNGIFLMS